MDNNERAFDMYIDVKNNNYFLVLRYFSNAPIFNILLEISIMNWECHILGLKAWMLLKGL